MPPDRLAHGHELSRRVGEELLHRLPDRRQFVAAADNGERRLFAAARRLDAYDWPGNVRELQNTTERALILAQKGVLQFDLAQADMVAPPPPPPPSGANGAESPILTQMEWRQRERENTQAALAKSGWRIHGAGGAAELLGLKPTTLISRMKKLGLKRPEPAAPPQAH